MSQLFETVLQISLSMTVVLGVLLLLVPVWQKHYSAKWRKVIWLVMAVRLLIPFSLELPQAPVQMNVDLAAVPAWQEKTAGNVVMGEADGLAADTAIATDPVMQTAGTAAQNRTILDAPFEQKSIEQKAASKVTPLSRGQLWALVWLVGMIVFLLVHGSQYVIFRRRVLESAQRLPEQERLLQQAGEDLNLHRYPVVLLSRKAQGPMLIGFLKSMIILPERIYNGKELLLILRHELVHYQQHDLWYKLLLLLTNAVHWFNPFVYWMNRQANRDVEQVCDDKVVANRDLAYRKAYSMTILNAMSSSRGIVLSTYLSKEAQNSKKRFAEILYPQKYGRGLMMLCVVVLLAVATSGCLQVGEKDAGVALYEQVAPWLPENAIESPEDYLVNDLPEQNAVQYLWLENLTEASEEIVSEKQQHGCYVERKDGKQYYYDRALEIRMAKEDQKLQFFRYQRDEMQPLESLQSVHYLNIEEREPYLQEAMNALVDGGETLQFERMNAYSDIGSGYTLSSIRPDYGEVYLSKNTLQEYQYVAKLDGYGYLAEFQRRYHDASLQQQMTEWLAMEQTRLYAPYYDIEDFTVRIDAEKRVGNLYTLELLDTMQYRNQGDRDNNTYLNQLKAAGSSDYERLYQDFHKRREANMQLKLEAEILPNGRLDLEHCKIYYAMDGGNNRWQQLPGFYVFVKDGQEMRNWSVDKTQALFTADCYLQAYMNRDTEKMQLFSTVEPIALPSYDYKPFNTQILRESLWQSFTTQYNNDVPITADTVVQVCVPLDVPSQYLSYDYLNMTLQKVDGIWAVTEATMDDFRIY